MLVLTRPVGTSVIIDLLRLIEIGAEAAGPTGGVVREAMLTAMEGDSRLEVMVVRMRPGLNQIGVRAPRFIPVHRKEIQEEIDRQQKERDEADARWMSAPLTAAEELALNDADDGIGEEF